MIEERPTGSGCGYLFLIIVILGLIRQCNVDNRKAAYRDGYNDSSSGDGYNPRRPR